MTLFNREFVEGAFVEKKEDYEIFWKVNTINFGWKINWKIKGIIHDLEILKIDSKAFEIFPFFVLSKDTLIGLLSPTSNKVKIVRKNNEISFVLQVENDSTDYLLEGSLIVINIENKKLLLEKYREWIKKENKLNFVEKIKINTGDYELFLNKDEISTKSENKLIIINDFIEEIDKKIINKLKDRQNKIFAKTKNYLESSNVLDGYLIEGTMEENYIFHDLKYLLLLNFEDNFEYYWKHLFKNVLFENDVNFAEKIISVKIFENHWNFEYINNNKERVLMGINRDNKEIKMEKIPFISIKKHSILKDDGRIFNFYGGEIK
jgi:hypothetical protein